LNISYLTLKGLGFRGHAEVPIDDIARAIGENLLLPKLTSKQPIDVSVVMLWVKKTSFNEKLFLSTWSFHQSY